MRRHTHIASLAALGLLAVPLAACSSGSTDGGGSGELTSGPIEIWYSTNEQEIAWGEQVVEAWNADHPDEQVTAQAIPAGSSSEDVIAASITAGNTPCLVFNTAPSAVPAFQKQGGLVNLSKTFDDAEDYITSRSGGAADGFRSADGDLYQLPWKTNPFMLYYNKDVFAEAGLDPENPALETYDDVLAAAKAIKESGAADYALYPPATADYTNVNFDFYPFFLANSGGTQLIQDGEAAFAGEAGLETLEFWQTLYSEGYSSAEAYSGDMWAGPFADGVSAMGVAGPWGKAQFDEQGGLRRRLPAHLRRHRRGRDLDVRGLEEHRSVQLLREPADRMGLPEVRHERRQRPRPSRGHGSVPHAHRRRRTGGGLPGVRAVLRAVLHRSPPRRGRPDGGRSRREAAGVP